MLLVIMVTAVIALAICLLPLFIRVEAVLEEGRIPLRLHVTLPGGLTVLRRQSVLEPLKLEVPRGMGGAIASWELKRYLFRASRWLRWNRVSVEAEVGTGEAFSTALTAGAFSAASEAILAAFIARSRSRPAVAIRVRPVFREPRLAAHVEGIGVLRLGHIIKAGWLELGDRLTRNRVLGVADLGPASTAPKPIPRRAPKRAPGRARKTRGLPGNPGGRKWNILSRV